LGQAFKGSALKNGGGDHPKSFANQNKARGGKRSVVGGREKPQRGT